MGNSIIMWWAISVCWTVAIIMVVSLLGRFFLFMRKAVNKTLTKKDKNNAKLAILWNVIVFIGGCLGALIFWWFSK